ncbi:MAG: hypothetical protein P8Y45_21670 [Exilibacterium sp.]
MQSASIFVPPSFNSRGRDDAAWQSLDAVAESVDKCVELAVSGRFDAPEANQRWVLLRNGLFVAMAMEPG